ncbi:MAG: acyl-CoA dehydrogenase family protein, partial [Actinomycetes bacterium]
SLILTHTADTTAHADIVQSMASGQTIVTAAFAEPNNEDGWTQPRALAERHGGGWHFSGRKVDVLAVAEADIALVTASIAGGDSGLFMVDLDADCVVRPSESIDPSRRIGTLELRQAEATLIDCGPTHAERMERALSAVLVAQAAETVGATGACLDATLGYLKMRHQFGQPIGSYQAIQHRCADLYVALVAAKAATTAAARDLFDSPEDHRVLASSALSLAVDNALNVAEAAVQLHGAIGYTWEHDTHLFLRRALLSSRIWGDSSAHRRQAARVLWPTSATDRDAEVED